MLLEMNVDEELEVIWRSLVEKIRKDIAKMTPGERANFFAKILPFYKSKREEVNANIQWDLDSLATKYRKVRQAVEEQN